MTTTKENFHVNAALLIVTAAEKSGLLQEIAQVLRFADKYHHDMLNGTVAGEFCLACEMREELIEAFDEHTCLAYCVLESFHSEGFVICEASDEELAPYHGISSAPSAPLLHSTKTEGDHHA